jgi:ubiquinone/menaquinone biosynthesis C-methylase UbiE
LQSACRALNIDPEPGVMSSFKDHFSRQSAAYSRHRPGYPPALIEFVAAQAPARALAIDCATGSGQAASQLAGHFALVMAIDGSQSQLANARVHSGVQYVAATAESLPVRSGHAQLVAAAQALHWFDFERFYAECQRVLTPGGIVAAWTYENLRFDNSLDAIVADFYEREVGAYWPPERRYVEQGYRTLPFPFDRLQSPPFELETEWALEQVLGYLETWSAVQRYKDARGEDPLPALRDRLAAAWPQAAQPQRVRWPIHLLLGRV